MSSRHEISTPVEPVSESYLARLPAEVRRDVIARYLVFNTPEASPSEAAQWIEHRVNLPRNVRTLRDPYAIVRDGAYRDLAYWMAELQRALEDGSDKQVAQARAWVRHARRQLEAIPAHEQTWDYLHSRMRNDSAVRHFQSY
jgi:hypothetical protein